MSLPTREKIEDSLAALAAVADANPTHMKYRLLVNSIASVEGLVEQMNREEYSGIAQ